MHNKHSIWGTVSGTDLNEISRQTEALAQWGVEAIEYRVDLIPEALWDALLKGRGSSVPWWIAHFGTGSDAPAARRAIEATVASNADGAIFHSRCEQLDDLIRMCSDVDMPFAAPYHSQEPLTLQGVLDEYAFQVSLSPKFRKIAVRAHTYDDAAALIEGTRRASVDGGSPVVGAVFGPHRWARIALPYAGSAITFVVARQVVNEVGGNDQQLQIGELAPNKVTSFEEGENAVTAQ
jgi:hypothetical protein